MLGSQQPLMDRWEKVLVELPSEKLILPLKEPRLSSMPARIEGLAIVRQKQDSKLLLFVSPITRLLFDSFHSNHARPLPLSTVHSSKDRTAGYMGCNIWIGDPFPTSWNAACYDRHDCGCPTCFCRW